MLEQERPGSGLFYRLYKALYSILCPRCRAWLCCRPPAPISPCTWRLSLGVPTGSTSAGKWISSCVAPRPPDLTKPSSQATDATSSHTRSPRSRPNIDTIRHINNPVIVSCFAYKCTNALLQDTRRAMAEQLACTWLLCLLKELLMRVEWSGQTQVVRGALNTL